MKIKETKIGILSLGCARNLVDSEGILGRLKVKGYKTVDMDKADVAIVNTCAFLEDAKRESIDAILYLVELKKEGRLKKIIVYGCLAQRYKTKLKKELPEVDAFIGRVSLNHNLKRSPLTPKHYAYLKICEGCINNCSYCVIPKIKGRFASLDMPYLSNKAESLDREGAAELNIIGQDITGYGTDLYGSPKLVELSRRIIARAKNINWIRLLYLHPARVTDELLDLIKDEPKVCKYIDLPIQHISERILKLMNRHTTKKDILNIIAKIRKAIPDAAIRTSLITGFPSETDRDFKELLDFIEDARFERLGAFIYSREEDTPAHNFKGQIPPKIKMERFNAVMSAQQKISRGVNEKLLGKIIDVLIEEKEDDSNVYLGRSQYDAPEVDGLVYVHPALPKENNSNEIRKGGVKSNVELRPGDFVKIKVTDTLEYDLVGEVISEYR